jgi:hypothetical protein
MICFLLRNLLPDIMYVLGRNGIADAVSSP